MPHHKPVLETVPDCTCYRFRQIARLLSRNYDAFLAEYGITIGQFGLLVTIAARDGDSITQVAEVMKMDRTTLTRNLTPLQTLGYVAMESGTDKRTRALRLSSAGVQLVKAAFPQWEAAQRQFEKLIGPKQVKRLNRELDVLIGQLAS